MSGCGIPEARDTWRLFVSTIFHTIYVVRIRRLKDLSLTQAVHTTRARNLFQRSVRRFRESKPHQYMRGY